MLIARAWGRVVAPPAGGGTPGRSGRKRADLGWRDGDLVDMDGEAHVDQRPDALAQEHLGEKRQLGGDAAGGGSVGDQGQDDRMLGRPGGLLDEPFEAGTGDGEAIAKLVAELVFVEQQAGGDGGLPDQMAQ
jgi:hypothetical protein